MIAQVSYSVETIYDEPADFAQLVTKKFISTASGLLIPCTDDPTFVVINVTGKPSDAYRGLPSVSGLIVPTLYDVDAFRQQPIGHEKKSLTANNGAELNDHVIASLEWVRSNMRSLDGWTIEGGPYGDPNPDPNATQIALKACQQWVDGSDNGLDDSMLIRLLEDEF